MKFDSDRLKESHYRIKKISFSEASLNGEMINISDSELIRVLFRITNKKFSEIKLKELQDEKKKLSKSKNSVANRNKLKEIHKNIEEMLFVEQLITIQFKDKRHFKNIKEKGLFINGKEYCFFMASAGQTRRDQSLFIEASIKKEIAKILNNGRNEDNEIVPQKFSAYYSLYSSSSQKVDFPKICIVPDILFNAKKTVNFSKYLSPYEDPLIKKTTREFEFNGADGQGIMSPSYAKRIRDNLELDYIPSAAIIRAPFCKGLLVTFDFHELAKRNGITSVKDAYENTIEINEIDVFISQSQFKLWDSYNSTQDYVSKCKENELGFSVSKISPKEDKTFARSSYQFIQILQLEDDKDIEELCSPTLNWLESVLAGNIESVILFLTGNTNFEKGWFQRLDTIIQALLLENSLIKDSFFISYLDRSISKKKKDAKLGRLMYHGNYSFMVSDPFFQASWILGMGANPLLKEGEHYSKFWNNLGVNQVSAIRSPIVHASEIDTLNLQNREDVNYWYKYLDVGCIVFPANGIGLDFCKLGGADSDGDLVCTINHPSFIKGTPEDMLPVMYDSRKAPKYKINTDSDEMLIDSQIKQVRSNKIGFYTNLASTYTAMLSNFAKNTKEYKTILNRLFYFRILQGENIDSTKGVQVNPFLEYWVKYKKIRNEMSREEKELHEFNNSLIAEKRPFFFVHLYSHYMRRYKREKESYDSISKTKWSIPFDGLTQLSNPTKEQSDLLNKYKRKTHFINNDSLMNKLSRYVDEKVREIKSRRNSESKDFDYSILLSSEFKKPQKRDLEKMQLLYKEYRSLKRSLKDVYNEHNENNYSTIEQIFSYINKKAYSTISSNSQELSDTSIYLCYQVLGKNSRNFCWNIFGREIVQVLKDKKNEKFVRVPLSNPKGKIQYLWRNFGMYLLNIEED
jgi:hypothetical protein